MEHSEPTDRSVGNCDQKKGNTFMSSYCVRKPYTVVVAVIMVLVLGVISFFGMTTDLLPTLELPYIVVVTTYPGADPERVETGVTAVLESGLGTVNGLSLIHI